MGTEGAKEQILDFNKFNLVRAANNYLTRTTGGNFPIEEIDRLNGFINEIMNPAVREVPKYKVGLMFICINQHYWPYGKQIIEDAKLLFLPGHDVEILLWSDMPNYPETKDINYGATVFAVDSVGWPYPTLMRYHLILNQEDYLKKFDYIFFLDCDMRIVGVVGDEILPQSGLTMAQHPMYALRQSFWNPYEPNPQSSAYFKQPGRILQVDGKTLFQPLYAAGGFQGGKTADFIKAMKAMKKTIDEDFGRNYIARWNDESHWNRYLFDNPPSVVLSPSYVYPDSMIEEYYKKLWGCDYPKKIITLTKPFSVSSEGGAAAANMIKTL